MSQAGIVALSITGYLACGFVTGLILSFIEAKDPDQGKRRQYGDWFLFSWAEVWIGGVLWPLIVPVFFAFMMRTYPNIIKRMAFNMRATLDD